MTKLMISAVALGVLLSSGGLAVADQPTTPGNSTPGIDRYTDNPGRQQATDVGAQCGSGAGSGSFGYFGKDNNLAGGADGHHTGLNNSSVCGNRQSNN
jgi:hypothetical protein